jgi:leader peptidase (prepilin peptidase) / N-methyltransferase
MSEIIIYIWVFFLGLAIGSFLNVLIYRIPRKIGFGMSRSFCPSCKAKIKFYDNIPVFSYIILGGKCRSCRSHISCRYPIVELLNGLGFAYFFAHYGLTADAIIYAALISLLITIFFIDLDFQIIPDLLSLSGMVLGLAVSVRADGIGIVNSLIGLLVGGGALYLIAMFGEWIFKKESMGGGDIKMAAMLGAFLGWQKVILIFFGAAGIALVTGIMMMIYSSKFRSSRVIPFGPFLAVAAVGAIIYGDAVISFYWHHFLQI